MSEAPRKVKPSFGELEGYLKKPKTGKVEKVMGEYGRGELHSGSSEGPVVTNHRQAVAIALSEARKAKKK